MRSVTTRVAGLIILIAGIWGGLIPFVGPYFHFTLGPDNTWTWTSARFYLDVLPSIAAVVGGLLLLAAGPRFAGRIGALLALAGGVWFAVGPDVSRLWHAGGAQGIAHGHTTRRMLEYLTFHSGLGVLIVACAAYALPGVVAFRRRATAAEAAAAGAAARAPAGRAATAPAGAPAGTAPATAPAGTAPAGPATAPVGTAAAAGAGAAATRAETAQPRRRRLFGLFGRRRRASQAGQPIGQREGVAPAGTASGGNGAAAAERESVGAPERR
jgi:hypothetical protein